MPQWNCGCTVCALIRARDPRVRPASQAGLAVSGDGLGWVLVNASPDLRAQLDACAHLHPRGLRHSPVTDVILTGAEVDQVAGLLTMREGSAFRLHATAAVHAELAANPIFDVLRPEAVERRTLTLPGIVEAADLRIEIIPVAGKPPLYLEDKASPFGPDDSEAIGLLIAASTGRQLAYVPGCAALTPALLDLLQRADVVLFDGTLFRDDEMTAAGLGPKTGLRMGHLPMTGDNGTLDLLRGLAPRRCVYTHINNSNLVLVAGSPERLLLEEAGVEIAFDGMEIAL